MDEDGMFWFMLITFFSMVGVIYYDEIIWFMCRFFVYLYGIRFSKNFVNIMKNNKRLIVIYPHTSYMDSFLMLMIKIGYPEYMSRIKFLLRGDFLDIPLIGWWFQSMGAIHATSIKTKNGGRTQQIIDELNGLEEYHLLISPKGTTKRSDWKTGYYHIYRNTDSKIVVCGIDYVDGIVKGFDLKDKIYPDESKLRSILIYYMRRIAPRNVENVEY
jgi:1-acyl-sn-glycerol-3-phosphate acyltransferase